MITPKPLDTVQPYIESVRMEKHVLFDVLHDEGLDPGDPLVANGVSVSNVGDRRTYYRGRRVLVRFHFIAHLLSAVEIPGRSFRQVRWVA